MEEEYDDLPVFGDNVADMVNAHSQYPLAVEELSDDEREDYYIKDSDALIVAGKVVDLIVSRKRSTLHCRCTCTSRS
jgi:hypothetical protein